MMKVAVVTAKTLKHDLHVVCSQLQLSHRLQHSFLQVGWLFLLPCVRAQKGKISAVVFAYKKEHSERANLYPASCNPNPEVT